jgi:hypothetical protein
VSRATKHQGYLVQSYGHLGWHTAHSVKSIGEAIKKCDRLHKRLIVKYGHPRRTRVVGPDGERVYPPKKKPGD